MRRRIFYENSAIFRDLAPVTACQFIILPNAAGGGSIVLVKTLGRAFG
jgi:hypothetical protein